MVRLGEVEPRERAGAETAQRYEFQYQRTARATLTLLDDATDHVCVYCDWHDDYVIEVSASPTRYVFHQVVFVCCEIPVVVQPDESRHDRDSRKKQERW